MNRLTARDEHGNAYYPKCFDEPCNGGRCTKDMCDFAAEVCNELAAYEDAGISPEQIIAMDEEYMKLAKELGEYKRMEEQGLLLKLPAKIGSTIYWLRIYDDSKRIFPIKVVRYATKEDKSVKRYAEEIKTRLNGFSRRFSVTEFGKTLFLTQEEAEKTLEEMAE